MKIAYFSNQFAMKGGHGIARYSKELFRAMRRIQSEVELVPVSTWSDRKGKDLTDFQQNTGLKILPGGSKVLPLSWKYLDFPALEKLIGDDLSLVHTLSPGYPIATRKPFLVTIHDIGPLTHPQFFTKKDQWLMTSSIKQAARKAAGLICVSQSTADELMDYVSRTHKIDLSERIKVIHEGVGDEFKTRTEQFQVKDFHLVNSLMEKPFLLTVGKLSPRKNISRVFEAFSMIRHDHPDLQILTVGGDGWDFEQIKKKASELKISDKVHFLGFVSDELLRFLYSRAQAFVYPSLFEGFGLTVLEAMACGAPVITSNCSSLPEIAGESARLVDPHNSEEMAAAISDVLSLEGIREQMIRDGESRAEGFTWHKAATSTIDYYREILTP